MADVRQVRVCLTAIGNESKMRTPDDSSTARMSRWHEFLRRQCVDHSDDWRFARNAVATYFDPYKSLELRAPAAFYWSAFQQTRRYRAVIAAAPLLPARPAPNAAAR
jgi:hypothetical protein